MYFRSFETFSPLFLFVCFKMNSVVLLKIIAFFRIARQTRLETLPSGAASDPITYSNKIRLCVKLIKLWYMTYGNVFISVARAHTHKLFMNT